MNQYTTMSIMPDRNQPISSSQDPLVRMANWFSKAVPNPEPRNVNSQIACHIEEFREMLTVLQGVCPDDYLGEPMRLANDVLAHLEKLIKTAPEHSALVIEDLNRVDLQDALSDQIVTSVGVSYMLDMDPVGAAAEVARSNDSKFDTDGNPIFNQTRKIMKGPDYSPPNLLPYV